MLSFLSTGIMSDPKTGIPFTCAMTLRYILQKLYSLTKREKDEYDYEEIRLPLTKR